MDGELIAVAVNKPLLPRKHRARLLADFPLNLTPPFCLLRGISAIVLYLPPVPIQAFQLLALRPGSPVLSPQLSSSPCFHDHFRFPTTFSRLHPFSLAPGHVQFTYPSFFCRSETARFNPMVYSSPRSRRKLISICSRLERARFLSRQT